MPLSPRAVVQVDVQLRPRDPQALARFATAVSTPGSPSYGHYLERGRFAAAFGPSASTIAHVTAWLESRGLASWTLSSNHLTVHVAARAGLLERAFGVGLDQVRLADGRSSFVDTTPPLVPASLTSAVVGVVGLDERSVPVHQAVGPSGHSSHGAIAPRVATTGPQACELAAESAAVQHAYTANQFASAYGFTPLYAAGDEGAGATVAIFELETNLTSDISAFQRCYGTSAAVRYVKVDGGAQPQSTDGEAAMDIEVALGLAPKARFEVYQAPETRTGTLDEYTAIVDQDTAKVVTTSWGQCEAQTGSTLISAEGTVFEQAAAQGQTVISASGDDGSEGCQDASLAATDPGSQPFVTSVGGTTLSSVAHGPVEKVWNDSSIRTGAGGGGISGWHAMPAYQTTAAASLHVVSSESSGAPCHVAHGDCRETPDVAADADRSTGYVIYQDGGWDSNGGTSASAPLWAALVALADASKGCHGRVIGFANPALYASAAKSYASDFHDITTGNNDYTPDGNTSGLYPALTGYDMATGLGTPNASHLVATMCSLNARLLTTSTTLALSTSTATYGREGSVSFSATVTGHSGKGHPVGTLRIYSGAALLCSRALSGTSSVASHASCSLAPSELRPGTYKNLRAHFAPGALSSSDPRFAYAASASGARTLTVVRSG